MIDLLAAWGVTSAAGLIFKPILQDLYQELKGLTKDATEDWVKDFFKERLSTGSSTVYGKLLNSIHREPLDIAAGKAIKGFLEIVQDCLDDAELDNNAIKEYTQSIKKLLKEKSVRKVLGSPFQEDCSYLDTKILKETWEQLGLLNLPEDFDWDRLAKKYLKKVNAIYLESKELKEIFTIQLQQKATDSLEKLAGITTNFDLVKYQETILEKYGNLKLESLDSSGYIYDKELKIYQIFIPQNVKECQEYLPQVYELPKELQRQLTETGKLERDISQEELERYKRAYTNQQIKSVLEVIADDNYKYLVILGDPGSGKSTLLQYLAVEWAKLPLKELPSHPITLLIELRTYIQDFAQQRCHNFLEFIHKGSNWVCHLNQHELDKRLKKGEVRVLFDGLDEVFDPQQRANIITQIHDFTQTYPQVKVIVTSRIIGYKPQQLKDAEFHHFMLQDLEPKQIKDFLEKWHNLTYNEATENQKKQRITTAIKEFPAIQQLAVNPLLLTMMAILNQNQDLPRDRTELYKEVSKLLLHQWDVEGKRGELKDPELNSIEIDHRDKQAMLRDVAHFMQATEKGLASNLISHLDLEEVLTNYLKTKDLSSLRKVARLMIDRLRTRNFILCDVGSDYYAFVHRTFLEYFCAWWYIWQFKESHTLSIEQIKTEVYGQHWQDESWHEVLRLIAGMLEPQFVGEIIEFLMAQDGESANFANLFLGADCLGEVRNRKLIKKIDRRLLERLKQSAQEIPEVMEQKVIGILEFHKLSAELFSKVVKAIANNWKDEESDILMWLKKLVQSDDTYGNFRDNVVLELMRVGKDDPDTLLFLKQFVQSDADEFIQLSIIEGLTKDWRNNLNTLPLLKQFAQSGVDGDIRSNAVWKLASDWHDNPGIFGFLVNCAVNDSFVRSENKYEIYFNPRRTALEGIIKYFPNHPQIKALLVDRSENDPDEQVREFAQQALEKLQN